MQWAPTRNIEEGLHQSLKHKPKPNRGQAAHPGPQASAQNGDKLFRKASYEEDLIALLYRGSTFPVTRGADSSLQAWEKQCQCQYAVIQNVPQNRRV